MNAPIAELAKGLLLHPSRSLPGLLKPCWSSEADLGNKLV